MPSSRTDLGAHIVDNGYVTMHRNLPGAYSSSEAGSSSSSRPVVCNTVKNITY